MPRGLRLRWRGGGTAEDQLAFEADQPLLEVSDLADAIADRFPARGRLRGCRRRGCVARRFGIFVHAADSVRPGPIARRPSCRMADEPLLINPEAAA